MFSFQVEVLTDDGKREFQAESNMHWEDFHSRVLTYLRSASDKIELIYKFLGDSGRASHLNDAPCFVGVMEHLCQKAYNVRSRAVGLGVKKAVSIFLHYYITNNLVFL